jgi:hypothetical protein
MKASTLFLTIISTADVAVAVKFLIGPSGWAQSIGLNVTEPEGQPEYRDRRVDGEASAERVLLKSRNPNIPNSKTVKLRYGPFTIGGGGAYVLSPRISRITLITHVFYLFYIFPWPLALAIIIQD